MLQDPVELVPDWQDGITNYSEAYTSSINIETSDWVPIATGKGLTEIRPIILVIYQISGASLEG